MKILVIGAAIIDIIMKVESLPKKGDDILCENTSSTIGGCAYNVGSMLRNFKVEHDLFVPVGKGNYSDIIRKDLEDNGYEILAHNEKLDNGYCLTFVENDGERTFITVRGAEGDFCESWFSNLESNRYDTVYVAGYQTLGESGKVISEWLAKNIDKKIFYAPGPLLKYLENSTLDTIFSCKPILHLNKKEIVEFFNGVDFENISTTEIENYILKMYELTKNTVIVTLGEDGTIYYENGEFKCVPTTKAKVVDTIGAGDSHIATIIAALSMGKSLNEAVRLANKVASGIVSVKGPTMSKTIFLENNYI